MPGWMGGSVESGSPRLIRQLRQRVLSYRGTYADDEEILITLGAQNALCIVSMVLANRNRPIAIEDPGFHGARNAFHLAGHDLVGVPLDRDGLVPSAVPAGAQLVFTTPNHQFPVDRRCANRGEASGQKVTISTSIFRIQGRDRKASTTRIDTSPARRQDRAGCR